MPQPARSPRADPQPIDTRVSRVASFGRRAESYDQHAEVQREAAAWLAKWLPQAGEFGSCLEFGAGTGLLTRFLPSHFEHVEAGDAEEAMVEVCRRQVPGVGHRQRDAWRVQDAAERWDFITSASLLQWAPDPIEVLRNWRRILAPGGRMLLGFFVDPSLPEMAQVMPGDGPVTWRDPSEWAGIVEEAGMTVCRIESRSRLYRYPSARALWKGLHRTGAVVPRRIAPGRMIRMLRLYESMFRDRSGVYATWTTCRILAER